MPSYGGNICIGNLITQCDDRTGINSGDGSIIIRNVIINNSYGISVPGYSSNYITGNVIANNTYDIYSNTYSSENNIFHNNFINNQNQRTGLGENTRDNGFGEGNFWSDYLGEDLDGDAIGDFLVPHLGVDWYPLVAPINIFEADTFDDTTYFINIISNSSISDFYFNPHEGAFLKFNVTGKNETTGFCRVAVPKELLWTEDVWNVTVR